MKVYESHDHEFSTFWNHDSKEKFVRRKNTNQLYFVRENGRAGVKVNKWVFVNGEKYEMRFPEILHYPVSMFDDESYKHTVIYRGQVYSIAGLRCWTQDEVSMMSAYLNKIWPDITCGSTMTLNPYASEMDWHNSMYNASVIQMIRGNTLAVYRKITVKDLETPYKDIEKKVYTAEKDKDDAEMILNLYAGFMAQYLKLDVKRYKQGSFNLNDQMIKRLHLKINSKTQ